MYLSANTPRAFVALIMWTETLNNLRLCKIICDTVWGSSALQSIAQTKLRIIAPSAFSLFVW